MHRLLSTQNLLFVLFISLFAVAMESHTSPPLQELSAEIDTLRGGSELMQTENVKEPMLVLALGGGAALGYAHLGVLDVLEDEGIVPDMITGASMGSIVGGYYCAGIPIEEIIEEAKGLNIFKLIDWKLGGLGFFEWKKVRKRISSLLGDQLIEDAKPALICVAADLYTGERVAIKEGDLIDAMLASATIPGLYRPLEIDGRTLVDGGLVDEVPIYTALEAGADVVIAVDVSHPLLGHEMNGPFDVMRQAYFIIQMHNIDQRRPLADVVIRPNLEGLDFHRFREVEALVQVGRDAARAALPAIREALKHSKGERHDTQH
jgi:NTE family protein